MSVSLRSFKLRFADEHVRVVPKTDAAGCAFSGPGVDLRGADARAALAAAEPLLRVLAEFEPGIKVRSLSIDLERPRALASLEPATTSDGRPRAVRIDAGAAMQRLVSAAAPLLRLLEARASEALAARGARSE
jgi:hypothetical protein